MSHRLHAHETDLVRNWPCLRSSCQRYLPPTPCCDRDHQHPQLIALILPTCPEMRVCGPFLQWQSLEKGFCAALRLLPSVWLARSSPDSFPILFDGGVKTNWACSRSNWELQDITSLISSLYIRDFAQKSCAKICPVSLASLKPGPQECAGFLELPKGVRDHLNQSPWLPGRWLWKAVQIIRGSVATVTSPAPLWTAASAAIMMAPQGEVPQSEQATKIPLPNSPFALQWHAGYSSFWTVLIPSSFLEKRSHDSPSFFYFLWILQKTCQDLSSHNCGWFCLATGDHPHKAEEGLEKSPIWTA